MTYNSCKEWIKSNTNDARTIIEHRISNNEDRETLEDTLSWCEHEIETSHKITGWLESAVKEVCTDEQYSKIRDTYTAYMHNDFCENTEIGKEMVKNGSVKPISIKSIIQR